MGIFTKAIQAQTQVTTGNGNNLIESTQVLKTIPEPTVQDYCNFIESAIENIANIVNAHFVDKTTFDNFIKAKNNSLYCNNNYNTISKLFSCINNNDDNEDEDKIIEAIITGFTMKYGTSSIEEFKNKFEGICSAYDKLCTLATNLNATGTLTTPINSADMLCNYVNALYANNVKLCNDSNSLIVNTDALNHENAVLKTRVSQLEKELATLKGTAK